MRLVSASRLDDHRNRGTLAVVGCIASALLLVVLSALAGELLISAFLVSLGVPVILLLTRGLAWTINLVMVVGMFFAPLNDVRVGGPITASDFLFAVGLLMLAPPMLRRRIEISQLFLMGWLIMIVTGLISSVLAINTAISFNHMVRFVVAALMLPLAFMIWRPDRRLLAGLAAAYLGGASLSVLYAVTLGPSLDRPLGLTTHPNYLGLSSVLGATLVPYVAQHVKRGNMWFVWLAGLVCAYGVWISGSRASFVALGAVVVLYTLIEVSLLMAGALGFAGVGILFFLDRISQVDGTNALSRILGKGAATGADLERELALAQGMKAFKSHPLIGNGFEQALAAHNIYLQVAVSIGVIGAAGYLLVILSMVHPLFNPRRPNFRLAYPALAYALVGLFTNSLWDRFVWAVLAVSLVGVVLDNHQKGRHPMHHRTEPSDAATETSVARA